MIALAMQRLFDGLTTREPCFPHVLFDECGATGYLSQDVP